MRIQLPPLKDFVIRLEDIIAQDNFKNGKQALAVGTLDHGVHAFLYLFFEQHEFIPVRIPLEQTYSSASLTRWLDFAGFKTQCEAHPVIIIEYAEKLEKHNFKSFFKAINKGFYNEQGQRIPVVISTEKDAFPKDFFYAMNQQLKAQPLYSSINADLDSVRWVQKKYYQLKDESDTLFTIQKYDNLKKIVSQRKKEGTILPPQREKQEFTFSVFKKIFNYLPQHLKKHWQSDESDKHHGIQLASNSNSNININSSQTDDSGTVYDRDVSTHSPEDYTREMQADGNISDNNKNKKQTI